MKRMPLLAFLLGVALFVGAIPGAPQENQTAPLSLQREGYLFAGGNIRLSTASK